MTDPAYILKADDLFRLGNKFIERAIAITNGGIITTIGLKNKLTGREFVTTAIEFAVKINHATVLTARDFTVIGDRIEDLADGGKRLVVRLSNEEHGLSVEVYYQIQPDDFYLRKYLVVHGKKNLINAIEVEQFKIAGGGHFRFGGFGQPLFVNRQLFMGLEYPAGHNLVSRDKTIALKHYPGRRGEITSKTAVVGVCPDTVNNRVHDWFLKYLDRNRARPITGFFREYYNMQRGRTTESKTWGFDEAYKVLYAQGIKMDSIMVGTNQFWIEPKSVMREVPEHRQAVPLSWLKKESQAKLGAAVGIHVNTGGGRDSTDHKWLAEHFDMISAKYYCLADPRVKEELKKNLLHLLRKYDVAMFSFDWIWWKTCLECPKSNHRGHIQGWRYSREAITDAYIDVLRTLRKENPDIVLQDIEAELSPWWLLYAECLAGYTGEGPNLTHEYIAGKHRGWLKKNTVFPMSDIWEPSYHGIEGGFGYGPPKRKGEYTTREFLAAVLMPFLRGQQIVDVHWCFKNLTQQEKDAYIKVLKWGLARHDVLLANTTFILGDPARQEVYGYAHFREDNRGIIGIYNPAHWQNEKVKIVLDEKAHFYYGVNEPCVVKVVYPWQEILPGLYRYGDSVNLEVPGGGLMVLEVIPYGQVKEPLLTGCRYKVLDTNCCQLIGMPGSSKTVKLLNPEKATSVRIDGQPMPQGDVWQVRIKGKPSGAFALTDLRIHAQGDAAQSRPSHKISFRIEVPQNEKVRLRYMTDRCFAEEALTEVEGKENEHQAADKAKGIGQSATAVTLKNNGRQVEIKQREAKINSLVSVGRHPVTKIKELLRTWGTSDELSSGRWVFTLAVDSSVSPAVRVWLERETRLCTAPKVEFASAEFALDDVLPVPDEWADKQRTTLKLAVWD